MERIYPSKILIAGEYTVLNGSGALLIPYKSSFIQWKKQGQRSDEHLMAFFDYLSKHEVLKDFVDLSQMKTIIEESWYLDGTIPLGYGLGSSGAVTAAVWDRFRLHGVTEISVGETLEVFKMMESFFHGKSSGLDPLVSFYQLPVYARDEKIELLKDFDLDSMLPSGLALLDSGQARQTQKGVNWFQQQRQHQDFREQIDDLSKINQRIIQSMIKRDTITFEECWKWISQITMQLFRPLIPDPVYYIWKEGLQSETYYLKLCGAGGGGYFLVYCNDHNYFHKICTLNQLKWIQVSGEGID